MTSPDIDALLQEDFDEPPRPVGSPPQRGWVFVVLLALAMSAGVAIGAGMVLSSAGVASATVHRGCNGAFGAGLALLAGAGFLLGVARIAADRRHPHELYVDQVRMLVAPLVPIVLLALTAPGFMGCRRAERLSDWGEVGKALVGMPGMAIAAAAAFGLGVALTMLVRVRLPMEHVALAYAHIYGSLPELDEPDLVDRVLAEHESRETDVSQ